MLQFSPTALQTIHQAIGRRQSPPAGLRVGVVGSPCSGLRYIIRLESSANPDDALIDCQGLTVLVDADSVEKLQGVQIDFVEQGDRRGFTFDNPALSNACASCNKSERA